MVRLRQVASIRAMYRSTDSAPYTRQGEHAIAESAQSPTLVLIEPDDDVRDALSTLLRGEGWDVLAARDGASGERLLGRLGLTAVISESSLPDLGPAALLSACQARRLPLIFTGHELPLQLAVTAAGFAEAVAAEAQYGDRATARIRTI
jgi:CheY-like chemotaxis protein